MLKTQTTSHKTALALGAAVLLLASLLAIGLRATDADAKAAQQLGATKKTPKSACKESRPTSCRIVVHSTAFQTVADGKGSPFKVPSDGRLVAWSVGLGTLTESAIDQANGNYGGEPTARISVLKPKGKGKFKLTKQSPKVKLSSKLGTTPVITLGKSLKVKKGQRVAITYPAWIPLFANGLPSGDNQWIASRDAGECGEGQATDAKPQQKIGSTRNYGCRFNGERLLYWAYFVPDKKK